MKTDTKQHPHEVPSTTVFLHGFSGDGDGLRAFADAYVGKDAVCIDLPGFGGTPAPTQTSGDIRAYCEQVWVEIRRHVPSGRVRLVGHSHGAMIGYVLALEHGQDVQRLDLFCPVARPRFLPRLAIRSLHSLRQAGIPATVIIRFVAHPILVSLVTRYSFRPEWSRRVRQQITRMREREARYYSPVMFELMDQTLRFTKDMKGTRVAVPTYLCYALDENVAGDDDFEWYETHAAIQQSIGVDGGHLCVVANPSGTANAALTEGF